MKPTIVPSPPWPRWTLPLVFAVGSALSVWSCTHSVRTGFAPTESGFPDDLANLSPADKRERGEALFALHCAVCHGPDGRADGPASPYLFPPARDFSQGRFRLVSTENGAPLDRDLVETLRRGMPGSAMPAWSWLEEEDLWSLAATVRELAIDGLATELHAAAIERGEEMSDAVALSWARERLRPGKALPPFPEVAPDDASLARGAQLFRERCASCHGVDGSGTPEPRWNQDGGLNWARDFTAGFLKGGSSQRDLAWRILAGMPGTAMAKSSFAEPRDAPILASYVQSLMPPDSRVRLVHRREVLRVSRVHEPVPRRGEDPLWERSDSIQFVLSPLWWNDAAVQNVTLQALHDGDEIAIRVRWPDDTASNELFSDLFRADALALQFSQALAPPLFGMGSNEHRTHLWHWRSQRLEEMAGALDLLDPRPHGTRQGPLEDVYVDSPVYRLVEALPTVSTRVDSDEARGIAAGRTTRAGDGSVVVQPSWAEGVWDVVFVRRLEPEEPDGLRFPPGSRVQVACAIWNGAAGDEGPRKSISIWQMLSIAP